MLVGFLEKAYKARIKQFLFFYKCTSFLGFFFFCDHLPVLNLEPNEEEGEGRGGKSKN
jgi:hypothetical protein